MSIANPYLYGAESLSKVDQKLKSRATVASMAVALILVGAKLAAFFLTNSISLLSSLVDSGFDALASLLTLVSIMHAASPADADHRFGHGKIEALGALAQALLLVGTGVFLLMEAAHRFAKPLQIHDAGAGLGVMVLSIILTLALVIYQKQVIAKTGSVAIAANAVNYQGDLWMSASVFAGLALGYWTKWPYFDPIFACGIALRLLWSTWRVACDAFDILLDKELPDADRARIMEIVLSHPAAHGIHDLRSRNTGERLLISFHVEMDALMNITAVHNAMDELEEKLFHAFPRAEVFIHPEPAGLDDHRVDNVIKK